MNSLLVIAGRGLRPIYIKHLFDSSPVLDHIVFVRYIAISTHSNMPQKVVVVGAGPVGSLAALYAAIRGYEVEIYELRPGMFSFIVFLPIHKVYLSLVSCK